MASNSITTAAAPSPKYWNDYYQDASFNGVPFHIISASEEVSRATVTHSYPFKDGGEVEDLGLAATRHTVRAILFGATAASDYANLKRALETPGSAVLQHPIYGSFVAVVESFRPAFDADNTDSVALDIVFIESSKAAVFSTVATPTSVIAELKTSIDKVAPIADLSFAQKLRKLLNYLNNNELTQLLSNISNTMAGIAQLSKAVRSTAQSYLDAPVSLMSDLRSMLASLDPHLDFSSLNNLLSGTATVATFNQLNAQLALITSVNVPAGTSSNVSAAAQLLSVNVQLNVSLALAQMAQAVLMDELAAPAATPAQIASMNNVVRSALQSQINALSTVYSLEISYPLVEALKNIALLMQQASQQIIESRPPLVLKPSPVSGNLRLIAHALYGDHTRAPELFRLNAAIRSPNFIQQGELIHAFAQ